MLGLAETSGEEPARAVAGVGTGPGAANSVCQQPIQLIQAAGTGDVQLRQSQPEPRGVAVGIDEAGSDSGTAKIEHLNSVQAIQVLVQAHDAALPDAQRAGHRAVRIHGDDLCVPQEEVEFHVQF